MISVGELDWTGIPDATAKATLTNILLLFSNAQNDEKPL
ncbi:unknow [Vibrio campbellii]|nr:unknow [Vibrio campbellii]